MQPPQGLESDESINRLRDAILDAFISIIHGMQPFAQSGTPIEKRLQNYAVDILHYIDALLMKPSLSATEEFVKNVYEIYSDISEYYGEAIRGSIRQMAAPKILNDGISSFRHFSDMN